jgi:hypothetical protein
MSGTSRTGDTWPGPGTPKGRGALARAMRARAAVLDRAIADWPDDDRATLTTLMTRLADSLDRLRTDPETR